jgi:hypothetical protein
MISGSRIRDYDMSLARIIYISESLISPACADAEIAALVAQSRSRNVEEAVSGCLLFSVSHFAQILEGPEPSLTALMDSIHADVRHHRIRILERKSIADRCFLSWGLGYGGPSLYVTKVIRRAADEFAQGRQQGVADLKTMMLEFAEQSASPDTDAASGPVTDQLDGA